MKSLTFACELETEALQKLFADNSVVDSLAAMEAAVSLGLVDLEVDREVLMLYTSFMPNFGPALLWSCAPEAYPMKPRSVSAGADWPGADRPFLEG